MEEKKEYRIVSEEVPGYEVYVTDAENAKKRIRAARYAASQDPIGHRAWLEWRTVGTEGATSRWRQELDPRDEDEETLAYLAYLEQMDSLRKRIKNVKAKLDFRDPDNVLVVLTRKDFFENVTTDEDSRLVLQGAAARGGNCVCLTRLKVETSEE